MKSLPRVVLAFKGLSESEAARLAQVMQERIERRAATEVAMTRDPAMADVLLAVDPALAPEGYEVDEQDGAVRIRAGSTRGVWHGAGKFLRTSGYEGGFSPSRWRGASAPHAESVRGVYLAAHFDNWYERAPAADFTRYVEDLALWGCHALWLPGTRRDQMEIVKEMGLALMTGMNPSSPDDTPPEELRAADIYGEPNAPGSQGIKICPSRPAGREYILGFYRRRLEALAGIRIDYVVFWPYDSGGCACGDCQPWGANGFPRMARELAGLAREFYPEVKIVLSTWLFDTPLRSGPKPADGEWRGLAERLAREEPWVDYIMADALEEFPRYPLEKGVPGEVTLLNFPEISMWGNFPWGGYGAHVNPTRLQRLWDRVKGQVRGGFPYSEGIYEDLAKVIMLQLYWDPEQPVAGIVREYAGYEFGSAAAEDVLRLVGMLEDTVTQAVAHRRNVDAVTVRQAADLAESLHSRLPAWARAGWRWHILHCRAILERERYAGDGLETPASRAALQRLIEIYQAPDDPRMAKPHHGWVRPPLK